MKTCKRGLHQYEGVRCPECPKVWRAANLARKTANRAAWRAANPEREKANRAAWRAANPRYAARKAAAWRAANPRYAAAWYQANRERAKTTDNAWRAENPEAVVEIRHRRRAHMAGNQGNEPVTREHLKLLFEAQDGCCRYCRTPLGKDKHLDHRIPISRGGPHAPSNVCWSCPTCNKRKYMWTESEFCDRMVA